MEKVLFICVENAGRSQMAEAFAKHYGKGKIEASSAGTRPAERVNPVVVEVMREKGFDLSRNKPRLIDMTMIEEADVMITMGCEASDFCPATFLPQVTDWKIEDPSGKPIERVRQIRDEIENRVRALINALG